ncbi:hypothetical protein C0995_014877, partial [Termitomyces sp. Mi166
ATSNKRTGTGDPIHQADDAGASPAPQAGEMPEASVYKPLPKRDDSDPHNIRSILNPGAWPEERTFASGVLPLLLYLELPEHIGQRRRSLDSLSQFGKMVQGSAYVHSTPFRPSQTAPLQKEAAGDDQSLMHTTQFQMINPNWTGRDNNNAREVKQAPSAPPAGSNQEKNGQKPPMRHKSLPGVLVEEPD